MEVRRNRVATGVPASSIVQFLDEYQIEEGRTLQSKFLKAYIQSLVEAADPATRLWNVAVIAGNAAQMSERPLGPGGCVACVTRNPLKNSGELAFVKAIMSRSEEHTSELQSLMRISYA